MTNMLIDSPIAITETTALTCGVSPINVVISTCNSIGVIPVVTANPQNRAYFEYREKGTYEWTRSEFQTDIESTYDFENLIEALDPATEYEVRSAYGKDSPTYYGSVEEFKTEFLYAFLGQSDGEGRVNTTTSNGEAGFSGIVIVRWGGGVYLVEEVRW